MAGQCALTICEFGNLVEGQQCLGRWTICLSFTYLPAFTQEGRWDIAVGVQACPSSPPWWRCLDANLFGSPVLKFQLLLAGCVTLGKSLLSSHFPCVKMRFGQ